ncbi:acetyltransferase [Citricoccus alkalitolerans]|uniref:Acetyltransferase n=1 Tax=Citricoccus alkalitolerans TaxID=246603 RepID=A0ABV8XS98_9MICC
MTGRQLAIVGAGGFGREVADVVEAINKDSEGGVWNLIGVFDDAPSEANLRRLSDRGISYIGAIPEVWSGPEIHFVVGIGSPTIRMKVANLLEGLEWKPATLVHPVAQCGSRVRIEPGTVVCAGVQISTNVSLGRHVHVNPNATIGHDSELQDFVSVNPAATVSGEVLIAAESLIGASATILQGLRIGQRSLVGASACVVQNVEADTRVKGIPAR